MRRAWLAIVMVWIAVWLLGWGLSAVSIREDDLGYLSWAFANRDHPLAWIHGPEWLSYWRPLNALVWWASARLGPDATLVRAVQVSLWAGTVTLLMGGAVRRQGWLAAAVAAVGLLGSSVFVDLLGWRSWLTTTGTLFGMSLGLVALTAVRPAPLAVLFAGLFALGFKETGAFALGVLALLSGPRSLRLVGGALVVAALASATGSSYKLSFEYFWVDSSFHLQSIGLFAGALPLLIAARWPRAPWYALVGAAGVALLPLKYAGLLMVAGVGVALWGAWPWLLAACAAVTPPLLAAPTSRQYVLESWLIVVAGLALTRSLAIRPWVVALSVAAVAPQAMQFARGRESVRAAWVEQQGFFRNFHPKPVEALYYPDTNYAYDLDMLVWLSMGAEWRGVPPEGSRPLYVGPRSGVWADLAPD